MNTEILLTRLEGVRANGQGKWTARCPSHTDRVSSLGIKQTPETVLIHCFAGCAAADVIGAIGLKFTDLYPERLTDHRRKGTYQPPPYRAILAAVAREATIVSIAMNNLDDELTAADKRMADTALANIIRMGDTWR